MAQYQPNRQNKIISLGKIMEPCLELGRAPAQSPETSFKVATMSGTAANAILASVQCAFDLNTNVMECIFILADLQCLLGVIVLTNF